MKAPVVDGTSENVKLDAEAGAEEAWEEVITSYDLLLDAEQRYVGMAVDMAIAERAEVFVGNGVSNNVVFFLLVRN